MSGVIQSKSEFKINDKDDFDYQFDKTIIKGSNVSNQLLMKMNLLKNEQNKLSEKIWAFLNGQVKTMLTYMTGTENNISSKRV